MEEYRPVPSEEIVNKEKPVEAETVLNLYHKEKFKPEEAKEKVDTLTHDFKEHYQTLGYEEVPSVPISSGIDPTVRFIGSHISVLKPYFMEDKLPTPGVFMQQDCIRTRNVDKLLDDEFRSNYGSFFSSLGVVARPERLNEACAETFSFLEDKLGIPKDDILIRINSGDTDLMKACKDHFTDEKIEKDSRNSEYYRHKLGIKDVWGRNFNIALRNTNDEGYSDIGNIIVLENAEKKLGVEVALGTSTILKQLHGLDHVQDCTPVVGLEVEDETIKRKFEDAIVTSTALFKEGLRPFGKDNRNRILKKYVKSLSYFRAKSHMDIEDVAKLVSKYESQQYPESSNDPSNSLIEFVKSYENELQYKKDLSEDDQKIKEALEGMQ